MEDSIPYKMGWSSGYLALFYSMVDLVKAHDARYLSETAMETEKFFA